MTLAHDFTLDRGETSFLVFSAITNLPVSGLAAYGAIDFTVKRDLEDTAALVTKSLGSGVVISVAGSDVTPGTLTITLAAADLSSLPAHQCRLRYDVQAKDTGASPHRAYTLAKGDLIVSADVNTSTS